jgi:hypothetical protein
MGYTMKYDLIMITTFIDKDYIGGFLESVIASNASLNLLVVIVDQLGASPFTQSDNPLVHLEWIFPKCRLSLSRARNMAYEHLRERDIASSHVMFPDDDSSFDTVFFERYGGIVREGESYLTALYDAGTRQFFRAFPREDGKRLGRRDFNYSLSCNLIIAHDVCRKVGDFDERLGVGAEYGAGEDRDYYLRACKYTHFTYAGQLHSFHPGVGDLFTEMPLGQLLRRYASYSRAYIYLVFLHGLFLEALKSVVLSLGASLYFLLRLRPKRSLVHLHTGLIRLGYACAFGVRYRSLFGTETRKK